MYWFVHILEQGVKTTHFLENLLIYNKKKYD